VTGVFILMGGVALFATVIGVLDLLAERKRRREHHRPT
jgi:hypothetical protein